MSLEQGRPLTATTPLLSSPIHSPRTKRREDKKKNIFSVSLQVVENQALKSMGQPNISKNTLGTSQTQTKKTIPQMTVGTSQTQSKKLTPPVTNTGAAKMTNTDHNLTLNTVGISQTQTKKLCLTTSQTLLEASRNMVEKHGLTEANLQLTKLVNYSLVGGFCRKNHLKGGVTAYAKEELTDQVKLISTSDETSELTCETALYELKNGKESLLGTRSL
ncbi:hypothetical protein J6590_085746 [Homalodisca vitripennis]|nr:hypothetical protein J6590_085746 [Homalodisca vitripennis]